MRQEIAAIALLVFAVTAHAQSTANTDDGTPPLTKSVLVQPGDSRLVRAAKLAVASRQNPSNRRVVTVNGRSVTGRGRFSQATGPASGPEIPPEPTNSTTSTASAASPTTARKAEEKRKAEAERQRQVDDRLKQLAAEEAMVGAEMDEPYGGDIEEDEVDARLSAIEQQRQELQAPPPPQQ